MSRIREVKGRSELAPGNVVDWWISLRDGRIVAFTLNYRAWIEGAWHAVVRYDTFHGHLHRHRFWRPEATRVEPLEQARPTSPDYGRAFQELKDTITTEWPRLRRNMEWTLRQTGPGGERDAP